MLVAQSNRAVAAAAAATASDTAASSASQLSNPYIVQRNMLALRSVATAPGLADFQTSLLTRNMLVADLAALKTDGIRSRVDKQLASGSHALASPAAANLGILDAAASIRGDLAVSLTDQIRVLEKLVDAQQTPPGVHHSRDVGAVLALVQLRINAGQHHRALSDLRSLLHRTTSSDATARHPPGLVALVMQLHRHLKHEPLLRHELARILSQAVLSTSSLPSPSSRFIQETALALVHSSSPSHLAIASSAFQALCADEPVSSLAHAGLVAALSTTNPSQASSHLATLPPTASLISSIDVSALLSAGVGPLLKSTNGPTSSVPTSKKRPAAGSLSLRPRKLPKSYDAAKTPDPERWLPLRDRSSYKPKNRKGKKKMADATQGGLGDGGAALDASGKNAAVVQAPVVGQVLGGQQTRTKKKAKK